MTPSELHINAYHVAFHALTLGFIPWLQGRLASENMSPEDRAVATCVIRRLTALDDVVKGVQVSLRNSELGRTVLDAAVRADAYQGLTDAQGNLLYEAAVSLVLSQLEDLVEDAAQKAEALNMLAQVREPEGLQ